MYYYVAGFPYSDELYHYGIKDQKWGRRRYQYIDGSLTPLGRIHYGYGKGRLDVGEIAKSVGKGAKATGKLLKTIAVKGTYPIRRNRVGLMTNEELKKEAERYNTVAEYRRAKRASREGTLSRRLSDAGGKILFRGLDSLAGEVGRNAAKDIAEDWTMSKRERKLKKQQEKLQMQQNEMMEEIGKKALEDLKNGKTLSDNVRFALNREKKKDDNETKEKDKDKEKEKEKKEGAKKSETMKGTSIADGLESLNRERRERENREAVDEAGKDAKKLIERRAATDREIAESRRKRDYDNRISEDTYKNASEYVARRVDGGRETVLDHFEDYYKDTGLSKGAASRAAERVVESGEEFIEKIGGDFNAGTFFNLFDGFADG